MSKLTSSLSSLAADYKYYLITKFRKQSFISKLHIEREKKKTLFDEKVYLLFFSF